MELTGEHRIPAPRQVVWEALHDPAILRDCVTGCESLEMNDDGTPKYQGIDQSKLVPLLTAVLQEAFAEIGALQTRIEALEAG